MSKLTEMVQGYRQGAFTLDQLRAQLAHFNWAAPPRLDPLKPLDYWQTEDDGVDLNVTPDSWDELLQIYDTGGLTKPEFESIMTAVYAAHPKPGESTAPAGS